MINWVNIKNFKSLVDTDKIDISPVTLLMGPNSSGKSSILQSLLLLKQTVDSRDIERSVQVEGAYVHLGPYRDFVFGHDTSRRVSITISFTPIRSLFLFSPEIIFGEHPKYRQLSPAEVVMEVTLGMGPQMQVFAAETQYTIYDRMGDIIIITKKRGAKGAYSGSFQMGDETYKFNPLNKAKFYDMTIVPSRYTKTKIQYGIRRILQYLTDQFETDISRIFYLGPLREEPGRLYAGIAERPQDVGTAGEDAVHVLWLGRREKKQIELRKKVERWMAEFGIAKEMKLRQLEGPYFKLTFADKHTGVKSTLADVGFGASQLLPVIVAGYYAPVNSLIIEEQPEIHLHPRAQTLLADLFIDIAKERKKLIIETHSEHILSRFQRRIAEGHIDNKFISIYYCDPSTSGTILKKIRLDRYGQLETDGLPEGFFDESYQESKAHIEAIFKKRTEK